MLQWLKLLFVLSPILTYGVQELRMQWAVDAAVAETKREERKVAAMQLKALAATIENTSLSTIVIVREGADATTRTPIDKAELKMLCDADPLCRDKGKE